MTHTPGPWTVDYAMGIRSADENTDPTPDAQLIAAAPELLETLEMILTIEPNYFSSDAYERSLWQNARETIAKATGKK